DLHEPHLTHPLAFHLTTLPAVSGAVTEGVHPPPPAAPVDPLPRRPVFKTNPLADGTETRADPPTRVRARVLGASTINHPKQCASGGVVGWTVCHDGDAARYGVNLPQTASTEQRKEPPMNRYRCRWNSFSSISRGYWVSRA